MRSDNDNWAQRGKQATGLGNNEMLQNSLVKVALLSNLEIEIWLVDEDYSAKRLAEQLTYPTIPLAFLPKLE